MITQTMVWESKNRIFKSQFSELFTQLIDVKASVFACGDVCANADKTGWVNLNLNISTTVCLWLHFCLMFILNCVLT